MQSGRTAATQIEPKLSPILLPNYWNTFWLKVKLYELHKSSVTPVFLEALVPLQRINWAGWRANLSSVVQITTQQSVLFWIWTELWSVISVLLNLVIIFLKYGIADPKLHTIQRLNVASFTCPFQKCCKSLLINKSGTMTRFCQGRKQPKVLRKNKPKQPLQLSSKRIHADLFQSSLI